MTSNTINYIIKLYQDINVTIGTMSQYKMVYKVC